MATNPRLKSCPRCDRTIYFQDLQKGACLSCGYSPLVPMTIREQIAHAQSMEKPAHELHNAVVQLLREKYPSPGKKLTERFRQQVADVTGYPKDSIHIELTAGMRYLRVWGTGTPWARYEDGARLFLGYDSMTNDFAAYTAAKFIERDTTNGEAARLRIAERARALESEWPERMEELHRWAQAEHAKVDATLETHRIEYSVYYKWQKGME